MGFSDYLENKILDHVFKGAVFTQPANLYVALFTAGPSDAGGGTEVSGGGYTRVNHDAWDVASSGATQNTTVVTFPKATSGWGVVTHVGVYDAATGGYLIAWAALTVPKAIDQDDTAEFPAGAIDITLD